MNPFIQKTKQGLSAHLNHNCGICPYREKPAECLYMLMLDAFKAVVNLEKRIAALKMENSQVKMEVDNEK